MLSVTNSPPAEVSIQCNSNIFILITIYIGTEKHQNICTIYTVSFNQIQSGGLTLLLIILMNLHKLIRFCLLLDDIISLIHKMLGLLCKCFLISFFCFHFPKMDTSEYNEIHRQYQNYINYTFCFLVLNFSIYHTGARGTHSTESLWLTVRNLQNIKKYFSSNMLK